MTTATPVLSIPYSYVDLTYFTLPVSGDDGFPQVFLIDLNSTVYRLTFTIMFSDPSLILSSSYATGFFNLPDPVLGLFLNLMVELENLPTSSRLLGVSRLVIGQPAVIGPLCFLFSRIKLAQANLVNAGSYGSEVLGQVAVING